MKEYIERAEAINAIRQYQYPYGVEFLLANIPAADVVELRHGRWLEYDGADKGFHYCSECKRQAINYEDGEVVAEVLSNWCPHCGARMDKEDEYGTD